MPDKNACCGGVRLVFPCSGAADVGGIADIVRDGETGLLARQKDPDDLADKILRILMEDELRGKLKKDALCFVKENFAWPTIAAKFRKVYEGVLRKGL